MQSDDEISLVDLTLDNEEDGTVRDDDGLTSRSNDEKQRRLHERSIALRQGLTVKKGHLTFDSRDIKSLSTTRFEHTRFSDLLQHDQYNGKGSDQHRDTFLAYIMEHENSNANLSIVNEFDREPCPKLDFEFTNHYVVHEDLGKPSLQFDDEITIPSHCTCDPIDGCDPRTCECRSLHRDRAPIPWKELAIMSAYDGKGLLREQLLSYFNLPIWECTKLCACRGDCQNTVVGRGRVVDLTLFKSEYKGWGLRTDATLKAGQFITVYAGELLGDEEMKRRANVYSDRVKTSYLMNLDPFHVTYELCTKPFKRACPKRARKLAGKVDSLQEEAIEWFTKTFPDRELDIGIDAGLWGNLSRFFNHSCDPNMRIHPVYTHERDLRRPFLAFFTTRVVQPGEELTFDYKAGTDEDSPESEGDEQALHTMACQCGASNCRTFLWGNRRRT